MYVSFLERNSIGTAVASTVHNSIGGTNIQKCLSYTVKIDLLDLAIIWLYRL